MILRPLAIILLVFYHAFIPYIHGWSKQPEGFHDIEAYWWIAKFSYSFMLYLFVFISGYVFALTLARKPCFRQILFNKFKRLYVPCIIFSTVYIFMFYDFSVFSFGKYLTILLSGAGHLWFLPMLFWAIIIAYLVDKIKYPLYIKTLMCCTFPLMSVLPIPFQLNTAFYYVPFFYLGIVFYRLNLSVGKYNTSKNCILIGGGYLLTFIIGTILINNSAGIFNYDTYFIAKVLKAETIIITRLIYSFLGVLCLYMSVNFIINNGLRVPNWLVKVNSICFGVYIFQQFILMYLYYHTALPIIVGAYWLPWIGVVVTLVLSILFSILLKSIPGIKQII